MNDFYRIFFIILMLSVPFLASCTSPPLEKAFKGKMDSGESNVIISDYCISCHVHKSFDPESHVFNVKYRYEDIRYAGKTECRLCHTYAKNWLLDVKRGTHWPLEP